MLWLLCLAWFAGDQVPPLPSAIDASKLSTTAPAFVAELDVGKLKGEPRQLAWSPDGDQLYVQTAEGKPPNEKPHHYAVALADGAVVPLDGAPDWAVRYWTVKQDRVAPGAVWLEIKIDRRSETIKRGTGAAGVLDRSSNPTAVATAGPTPENLVNGAFSNEQANVLVLSFQGEEIARWVNDPRPMPGTRFSWGPSGSGTLVHVGQAGNLAFLDERQHHRNVDGVKDALLPAWSTDGSRLAYLQKTAKKKYAVMWMRVEKR